MKENLLTPHRWCNGKINKGNLTKDSTTGGYQ